MGTGSWIPADRWSPTDPFCGVNRRADGVMQVGLRQWFVGWFYYVVAVWKP